MKRIFEVCAIFALFLVIETVCVQVFEKNSENVTTTVIPSEEPPNASLSKQTTSIESIKDDKARQIDDDDDYRITTSATTTTYKIPPTLLNTKVGSSRETSENPGKSLKELA